MKRIIIGGLLLTGISLTIEAATVSTVAPGSPKGYVEFYDGSGHGKQIPIIEQKGDKWIHLGQAASWMPSTRLLVECAAGSHTFRAAVGAMFSTKGNACAPLTVDVQAGTIKPICITGKLWAFGVPLGGELLVPLKPSTIQDNEVPSTQQKTRYSEEQQAVKDIREILSAAVRGDTERLSAGSPFIASEDVRNMALDVAMRMGNIETAQSLIRTGATYHVDTTTAQQEFLSGVYEKLVGDLSAKEGRQDNAKASYTAALAHLTSARASFSKQAEEANAWWKPVVLTMAISFMSSAPGLNGAIAYKQNAQAFALSHSKTVEQYNETYCKMMSAYQPPQPTQPAGIDPFPSFAIYQAIATGAKGLSATCDLFIAAVQKNIETLH